MPELPEVQTTVNDLNKKIIGLKITGAWFDWPKMIKKPKPNEFEKNIKNEKILSARRRAKNILIYLSGDKLLLIHQKMTGHLLVGKWQKTKSGWKSELDRYFDEKVNGYIHLIFFLNNGEMLALSDLRKFAKVLLGPKNIIEQIPELKKLGVEPFSKEFTLEKFRSIIKKEKRKIKAVLMDQEKISGIGNIYSDEILWEAKVHPFRAANSLTDSETKRIYSAIRKILTKALRLRGTSTSDFRDTAGQKGKFGDVLNVYRREGKACPRCGAMIERAKMGGRSAHFCPVCQKL
ncbi:MAG: DNA-formamidopyrimidine glycosylase [Patescibacteria group bacterium]|nr:DNA-formamidopyrimidine glycosylase [Patescibacteria group bacterium]